MNPRELDRICDAVDRGRSYHCGEGKENPFEATIERGYPDDTK